METQTLAIKQQFNALLKDAKDTYATHSPEYYDKAEAIKQKLALFLRNDFSGLTKNDLFMLCNLVNRHQPIALHVFLRKMGDFAKNCPTHKNL